MMKQFKRIVAAIVLLAMVLTAIPETGIKAEANNGENTTPITTISDLKVTSLNTTQDKVLSYDAISWGSRGTYENIVNYAGNGSYVEYAIDVQTEGIYNLIPAVSTGNSYTGFDILTDGELQNTYTNCCTWGWDSVTEQKATQVRLTVGVHVVRISFLGETALAYLKFEYNEPAIEITEATTTLNTTQDKVLSYSDEDLYWGTRGNYSYIVSYAINGTYVEYAVRVSKEGIYNLTPAVSTGSTGNSYTGFDILVDGEKKNTYTNCCTWGWDNVTEQKATQVRLTTGVHVVRVSFLGETALAYLKFEYNKPAIEITEAATTLNTIRDKVWSYSDKDLYWGTRGNYSDIISYAINGTYVEYVISVQTEGIYNLTPAVSTSNSYTGFDILVDGEKKNTYTDCCTWGWDNVTEQKATQMRLTAGVHVVRVAFLGETALAYLKFEYKKPAVSITGVTEPSILETTEENALSYHSNVVFGDRVDGSYKNIISWVNTESQSEVYVNYIVDVKTAGKYELAANVSCGDDAGGAFDVYVGDTKIAAYQFEKTGSWDTFWTYLTEVNLEAGLQVLKIVFSKNTNIASLGFTKPYAKVAGASLTLDGKIGVNFYFNPTPYLKESGKVQFTFNGQVSEQNITSANYDSEKEMYKFTFRVAAAQMADDIQMKVLDATGTAVTLLDSNGIEMDDTVYTASVKRWADYVAEDTSGTYADYKVLAGKMLQYGVHAKAYFDNKNNVSAVPDAELYLDENNLISYQSSITGSIDGITYAGMSLVLENETAMHLFFTLDDGRNVTDYSFQYNGQTLEPKKRGNMYYVKIANLAAPVLRDKRNLIISAGETQFTVTCSAYSYVYSVLTSGDNLFLRNVAIALYDYGEAAAECFKQSN